MLDQIFISKAFAQATETTTNAVQDGFAFSSFIPLILIFAVFYFLIVRPQSNKQKEHQAMINNLKNGAKVLTAGGIVGIVRDVNQKEALFEIEVSNGVVIKVSKNYIAECLDIKESKKEIKK